MSVPVAVAEGSKTLRGGLSLWHKLMPIDSEETRNDSVVRECSKDGRSWQTNPLLVVDRCNQGEEADHTTLDWAARARRMWVGEQTCSALPFVIEFLHASHQPRENRCSVVKPSLPTRTRPIDRKKDA